MRCFSPVAKVAGGGHGGGGAYSIWCYRWKKEVGWAGWARKVEQAGGLLGQKLGKNPFGIKVGLLNLPSL
jgi:hypothetical protein